MTADGLKCPNCALSPNPVASDLAGPAGPMPGKLQAVVALIGLGILLNLVSYSLLSVAFGVALLVGILAGNDGIRRFVIALAWINVILGGFGLAMVLSAGEPMLLAFAAFGLAQSVFVVWALMQNDVRDWMFKTAFKDGL